MSISKAEKIKRFVRFQLTAVIATTVDFLMTIFFKEIVGLHYSAAVASGAACGAITAFIINRHWVFKSLHTHPFKQAIRYFLVAFGSIILNTTGTFVLTESTGIQYLYSKAIVALVIGFTYSYYCSKRFVFNA